MFGARAAGAIVPLPTPQRARARNWTVALTTRSREFSDAGNKVPETRGRVGGVFSSAEGFRVAPFSDFVCGSGAGGNGVGGLVKDEG